MARRQYKSIYSLDVCPERDKIREDYWEFITRTSGKLDEPKRQLAGKMDLLQRFTSNPVRARKPLLDPSVFYRNYVDLKDDPDTIDRKTLLLMALYKFARHEWMGIEACWKAGPDMAHAKTLQDKIDRHHLAEEFHHVRMFDEIFRTFHLDDVKWVPAGGLTKIIYWFAPRVPGSIVDPPAMTSELMGIMFYRQVCRVLDEILEDEPEAKQRLRAIYDEIIVDELSHVGQRRNPITNLGLRIARWQLKPMTRVFFKDCPEGQYLFNQEQMVEEGLAFDYSVVPDSIMKRIWVPEFFHLGGTVARSVAQASGAV